MKKIFIAPSILSANFARLGEDIKQVLSAGGDIIHFDVMDNHYVPNLTFGPMVLKSLRNYNINVPIDVHLMIKPVDNLIPAFAKSGASYISFHPETSNNIQKTISLIKSYGCKSGLVINPNTSLSIIDEFIQQIDIVLIMGVVPGFSSQKFIPSILNKIYKARNKINKFNTRILLAVDGGINLYNIIDIVCAGADILIMGSCIFQSKNYKFTINIIKKKIRTLYL